MLLSFPGLPITLHNITTATTAAQEQATELRMCVHADLLAIVALRSPGSCHASRIVLCAAHEAHAAHGWATSAYAACRRASAVAMAAMQHYQDTTPHHPAALRHLLVWLATLGGLYSVPSSVTGQLLVLDPALQQLLPPVYRPFRKTVEELVAAVRLGNVGACHLQDVVGGY